jgi:hypothetical protein
MPESSWNNVGTLGPSLPVDVALTQRVKRLTTKPVALAHEDDVLVNDRISLRVQGA